MSSFRQEFHKFYLRLTDRSRYKAYKSELVQVRFAAEFTRDFHAVPLPADPAAFRAFSHAGHAGDIVYSLPVCLAMRPDGFDYLLNIGQPADAREYHPSGAVRLTAATAESLLPLLAFQPAVHRAGLLGPEDALRLDIFRELPMRLDRGHIARWYFQVFGHYYDLCQPWLVAPRDDHCQEGILISRSHRYRNPLLDYRFLRDHRTWCIGTEAEWRDLRTALPAIEYLPVRDFLHSAALQRGCRLFIGNQSFHYAVAEGLKVPRVLEVSPVMPNVAPYGPDACDVYTQVSFEASVRRFMRA